MTEVTQKQKLGETTQEAPDMDRAIDMFKRSNLEHELAAKEKEVKYFFSNEILFVRGKMMLVF